MEKSVCLPNTLVGKYLLLGLLFLLLQGCASATKIDPKRSDIALVYGYLDMEEAPSVLDWAYLARYKRGEDTTGYYLRAIDGVFYHVGVDMGSYQISDFGRNTRWYSNTRYLYKFDTGGKNETAVRIKKPGVYFLGSYAYKRIPSGSIFKKDKFSIEKTKAPSETEILRKVLADMRENKEEYTNQIAWVEKRIKTLE